MTSEMHNQVKEILIIIITALVGISCNLLNQYSFLWFVIIALLLIQILLAFKPSIEEKHFRKDVEHMQIMKEKERVFEEKEKGIKLSKKLKRLNEKADVFSGKMSEDRIINLPIKEIDDKYWKNRFRIHIKPKK